MYMEKRLRELLRRAGKAPYYRSLSRGTANSSVHQFEKMPLSNKALFDSKKIDDSLAVPKNRLSHYYFSAGTTGNPKMIPFTNREWIKRSAYRKELYELIGLNKNSRVAILLPFGPWVAGPSAQEALSQLGCVVFPIGALNSKEEIQGLFSIIKKHSIDTIITFPSFLQNFIAHYDGSRKNKIALKNIITSGEYIPATLRNKVKKLFGAETYSSYATSESFIGIECSALDGFHYDPKEILVEIVDPHTHAPTNETGLVVITVLSSEAVPIVRYNLDDLCIVQGSRCSCGSRLPRILWQGRTQETFVVAGAVNVYSYQIHDALSKSKIPINKCVIEITDNGTGKDTLMFDLYTTTQSNTWPAGIKKSLKVLLGNMSMDFNDVVLYKLVKIKVNLHQDENIEKNLKKRRVSIHDKREYVR